MATNRFQTQWDINIYFNANEISLTNKIDANLIINYIKRLHKSLWGENAREKFLDLTKGDQNLIDDETIMVL